jgi:thymidylate synthase
MAKISIRNKYKCLKTVAKQAKFIYDIINDLRHQPRSSNKIIQAYSIAADENTEVKDCAQLAVFVHV